jgi:hypothetical protein
MIGRFNTETDLFLAHFDSKTDVDDIHSIAGVATMLADERFSEVQYHAVAGAYGIQDGLYVPANGLFEKAFGNNWSDAHSNRELALEEVLGKAKYHLEKGGSIWIAEAGQSDFSADLVRSIKEQLPDLEVKELIHVVQHADWNEEVTSPEDLAYLKEEISYHKIPDGNGFDNGTPGFRSDEIIDWEAHITNARLTEIWSAAIDTANTYNGVEDRYLNTSIEAGGLDFSDVAETCWIFGFEDLMGANEFFEEFGQ